MTDVTQEPDGTATSTLVSVLLHGVRRYRLLVAAAIAVGVAIGLFRGLVTPNQYQSVGKLFVYPGIRDAISAEAALSGAGGSTARISGARDAVLTEMQVLSSPDLFDKVAQKVGIDVLLTPYDPRAESAEGLPWYTATFHSFQAWWFKSGNAPSTDFAVDRSKLASMLLANSVSIAPEPGASVITFAYVTHSPDLAQKIVNATLESAKELHAEVFEKMALVGALEEETKNAEQAAQTAAKVLREFRTEKQIYDFELQRKEAWTDLSSIDHQLETIGLDLKRREAERTALEAAGKATSPTQMRAGSATGMLSPLYTANITQLATLRQEQQKLELEPNPSPSATSYLDRLKAQIKACETRLETEPKELRLSGVEEPNPDYQKIVQRLLDIHVEVTSFEASRQELTTRRAAKLGAYTKLEEVAQALRTYELDEQQKRSTADRLRSNVDMQRMVQRLDQINLSSVRVMRYGSFEANKVAPRRGQMVAYGLIGGLFAGIAFAALLTLMDRRIRVREDLARLGLPAEGVLVTGAAASAPATAAWTMPAPLAEIRDDIAKFWTKVPFDRRATAGLRVAFVPCGEGANAGRAAAAFAIGLAAHGGERVLYVTCVEGPSWLAQRLGLQIEHGWGEVVRNECSLAMAAVPTPVAGLAYLGAGEVGAIVPHPMASHGFVELLDRAATEYRFVVIELPDLEQMSEGRSVLGIADAAEFVACAETSSKASVREAVAAARSAGTRLLGGVLQAPERGESARPARPAG